MELTGLQSGVCDVILTFLHSQESWRHCLQHWNAVLTWKETVSERWHNSATQISQKKLQIYTLSIALILCGSRGGQLEPIPADTGWEEGYTLDWLPVSQDIQRQTTIHSHIHRMFTRQIGADVTQTWDGVEGWPITLNTKKKELNTYCRSGGGGGVEGRVRGAESCVPRKICNNQLKSSLRTRGGQKFQDPHSHPLGRCQINQLHFENNLHWMLTGADGLPGALYD